MKTNFIDIQNQVISKYRIDLCDGTKCKDGDWSRTHAHIRERRVCKWKQENTLSSTITLFHEIGHIENNAGTMRRAEQEYHATTWAIDRLQELGIKFPLKTLFIYQRYIMVEMARGRRRGGQGYGDLNLYKYIGEDISLDEIKSVIDPKWGLDW